MKKVKKIKAWAVLDVFQEQKRWCYDFTNINALAFAIYDKKPIIPDRFKDVKEVIEVWIIPV